MVLSASFAEMLKLIGHQVSVRLLAIRAEHNENFAVDLQNHSERRLAVVDQTEIEFPQQTQAFPEFEFGQGFVPRPYFGAHAVESRILIAGLRRYSFMTVALPHAFQLSSHSKLQKSRWLVLAVHIKQVSRKLFVIWRL